MWEFTLNDSSTKTSYINFLYAKLEGKVKFVGGIIIRQTNGTKSSLSLAVPTKQKDYFVLLILELVSEIITLDYKYAYLESRLGPYIKNELTKSAFLKALTIFDKQTDKDLIKKELVLEKELNINSFYNFKLYALRNRWEDICNVIEENISSIEKADAFSELLKFLIKTSDVNYDEVHLYKKHKNYVILDKQNRPIDVLEPQDSSVEIKAITTLIALCPAKIVLHKNGNNKEPLYDYIFNLFDDKVKMPL